MMFGWLATWKTRRAHRRELEERAEAAERAERAAQARWPQVHRAADAFTSDMQRALRARTGNGAP